MWTKSPLAMQLNEIILGIARNKKCAIIHTD